MQNKIIRNNWTREETIVAFNVYCKVPFKNSSKTNPIIIKYANILGRTPSALNMKVGNFGRLDPELKKQGIVGLANGSKLEEDIWEEFNGNWEKLAFESELLISKFAKKDIEEISEIELEDLKEGIERETIIKQRVNQSFFRSAVLSSYNSKCCITGLSVPDLLVASHIIPWAKNKEQRLNPRNGLCLNSIHDKAFDKGFITISPDYSVKISNAFIEFEKEDAVKDFFYKYKNQKINLPDKFLPNRDFLDFHYQNIFKK
jgi:putative restriction endonuclease